MQQLIQFESATEGGIIRIPEQYMRHIPSVVKVTVAPALQTKPKIRAKTNDTPSGIDEFPAVLKTRGWKFSRDEANERR
jgi:hypothetical protein